MQEGDRLSSHRWDDVRVPAVRLMTRSLSGQYFVILLSVGKHKYIVEKHDRSFVLHAVEFFFFQNATVIPTKTAYSKTLLSFCPWKQSQTLIMI